MTDETMPPAPEEIPEVEVMTVSEIAERLRIGRSAAYQLARRYRVEGLGRSVRVPRARIEALLR